MHTLLGRSLILVVKMLKYQNSDGIIPTTRTLVLGAITVTRGTNGTSEERSFDHGFRQVPEYNEQVG
jgi:hypothetical protein